MPTPTDLIALVVMGNRVAIVAGDRRWVGGLDQAEGAVDRLEKGSPRWVSWAANTARPLIEKGFRPGRWWDIAEAHRIAHGGWQATPGQCWAAAHRLTTAAPLPPTGDLFDSLVDPQVGEDELVRTDSHVRADLTEWLKGADDRLLRFADAALDCARLQQVQLAELSPRGLANGYAESATAVLCEELRRDGLPVDRAALLELVEPLCGPPAPRDAEVLKHAPGREGTDLRNPAQVRELLRHIGIDVPSTRKHLLEPFVEVHPLVPALLRWRKEERIATTYGLRWIEENIGPDDRLRGGWAACDGAAGRMTAEAGLHNLPAMLRPAIAAEPGHLFVQADLGQVEPRVLAVVSGDSAFAEAAQADDLYAPVAARLGVERKIAKVAMLAAMYGQRSGAAGQALRGLERAYPSAMNLLDRAYASGVRGEALRTFGGRLIRTSGFLNAAPVGADPNLDAARGRFARNAIIQGSAAELFKAWVATVRATTEPLGAQIVLCLHDELIVHTPESTAEQVAASVNSALQDAARRWSGGSAVRFVTETSIVRRWSEAK